MLSTGEEIRSPQRSSRSGPILAKMPCTIILYVTQTIVYCVLERSDLNYIDKEGQECVM